MTRIFVPQPIPEDALERLESLGEVTVFPHVDRRISEQELLKSVAGHEVLYALGEIPYDQAVIDAATDLRLIAAMHVSAKFVDIPYATQRGIPVTGIPNMIATTTAELTFALLLATAWRIPEAQQFLADGKWQQNQSMAFMGTRLYGKTLGILGMGTIGQMVAERALACGMSIIYNKRTPLSPERAADLCAEYRTLEDLFRESDFISLNPALTVATDGLVGDALIGLMKPSAILINTSRGRVLDEQALERALRDKRIRGAGLDVYQHEIPEAAEPGPAPSLMALPNVVCTPHIGSGARETRTEMALRTVDNIAAFLAGDRPADVLNPEVYGEAARSDERIG